MNAFVNAIQSSNTSVDTTAQTTKWTRPIRVDTVTKITYPECCQNIDPSDFDIVRFVAESYSTQLGTSLVFRLTGYTDRNNYRFESSQFPFNGEWRRLVIAMNRGILNVISD